jgi:hypothetical protein
MKKKAKNKKKKFGFDSTDDKVKAMPKKTTKVK